MVQAQIKIHFYQLYSHVWLFDTGAGLKIVSRTFLQKEWWPRIRYQSVPSPKTTLRDNGTHKTFGNSRLFRAYWRHTGQSLVWHTGKSGCGRASRHVIHRLVYQRDTTWREKNCIMIFRTESILNRKIVNMERLLLHLEPSKITPPPYNGIIRIRKQITVQAYTKIWITITTPVSELSLIEPFLLKQHFSHVNVAQGIVELGKDRTFGILIRNFWSLRKLLLNRMVVENAFKKPRLIVDLPHAQASRTLEGDSNLACKNKR